MALILSPEVKLRQDGSRAILFSLNPPDCLTDEAFAFLYPQQAIMLSLFDGRREIPEIRQAISYLFSMDDNDASQALEQLLSHPVNTEQTVRSLLVNSSAIGPKPALGYDPRDFIVPAETIDMSDVRCKIPCVLWVLPTMRCNTSCRYCYADRTGFHGKPEFDLTLFKRLLKEAKECGIETLQISGGDIFCRDDAFDLIESAFSEGVYLSIPTKYPLTKYHADILSRMGLSTIQISIDAIKPELIDMMVGKNPGYGEEIIKTLNYLGEAGISVRTNSVLTPYNIHDAANLARHLAKMPHVFKSKFTCYSRSLYGHHDALFCSKEDISRFEADLDEIKGEFRHKIISFSGPLGDPYCGNELERGDVFSKRSFCTANRRGVIVLSDGSVTICEELYLHESFIIGDFNRQSLMEIWNSPKALEIAYPDQALVPDGACKQCVDFGRCHEGRGRCVRDTLKAYGYNRPHWPDPRCPRAPVGNRMA